MSKKTRLIIGGVVLLLITVGVGWWVYSQRDKLPPPSEVITHSTDKPSEQPVPVATTTYNVAPDDPKAIYLPSIGAEGLIQKMGIDQHNQIAVPTNINLAGWYVNSVKPGQQGLSVISGHVDGRQGPGVFNRLLDMKRGDEVVVEYGDGSKRTFAVQEVMKVVEGDASNLLFAKQPAIDRQLNLITCGGHFNPDTNSYEERVIVTAKGVE